MTLTETDVAALGRLNSFTAGADKGVPIVLLHGFGGSHSVWESVVAAVSKRRKIIAFDLPGHGGSRPWPQPATPVVAAKAVDAELSAQKLRRVHLVGHSMGGAVAALIAMRLPDVIASLTLLSPGGFGTEINGRLLRRYAVARDEATLRPLLEQFFGWRNPLPDRFVAELVAEREDPALMESLKAIADEIFKNDRQGVLPKEKLADLPCPVKVVWGTQDRVLPTRQAHHLPGLIASHVFEEVGHMLPVEIPGEVARLILQNAAHE